MNEYVGVYAILAAMPMWLVVLVALVIGVAVPFVIADQTSGLFFNYSYSGMIGDICLLVVVLIGATVIERGAPLPGWYASMWAQAIWFVLCAAVGVMLVTVTTPWPTAAWPDRYHNAVVVPLFLFFVPLLMLAVFRNGSPTEAIVCAMLTGAWVGLVYYDFADDRMNQPARLEREFHISLVHGRLVPRLVRHD